MPSEDVLLSVTSGHPGDAGLSEADLLACIGESAGFPRYHQIQTEIIGGRLDPQTWPGWL